MPTSKRVSTSFAALFFTGSAGVLSCAIIFNQSRCWAFDERVNASIIGLPQDVTMTEWIATLHPYDVGMRRYLQMLYDFALLSASLNCALILMIVFLAHANKALVLSAQLAVAAMSLLLYLKTPAENQDSIHYRLFATIVAVNVCGLLVHLTKLVPGNWVASSAEPSPPKDN